MSEDIKKYRVLLEQSFTEPMHEGNDMDMQNHEHMATLLIQIFQDSNPTVDELRDVVLGLKTEGHDNASIHKILDMAEQKLKDRRTA
jgi:hypothetical protein